MKHLCSLKSACLIAFGLVLGTAVQAGPPDYDLVREAGDIKGHITVCGEPGNAVIVYAPGTSFNARADGNGNFRLSYVQEGTYDLVIEKDDAPLGAVSQVIVTKKQTVDIGTHEFCGDGDGDGYDPPMDCDDNNPAVNPGVDESCGDGIDNNCNDEVDEGCTVCTDNDEDGFFAQSGCSTEVDCDDTNASINPSATESCDGEDNDCDGEIDESGASQTNYYRDSDSDGWGATNDFVLACAAASPSGYVSQPGDCDDTDPTVNPAAIEECDGLDNDCDTATDEDLPPLPCSNSEGVCNGSIQTCGGSSGWLACDTDTYTLWSNDYEVDEVSCDLLDNDCDAVVDEGCF